jgi:hypothetical protein
MSIDGSALGDTSEPMAGLDGKAWASYTGVSDLHAPGESYALDADGPEGAGNIHAPSTVYRHGDATKPGIVGRAEVLPLDAMGNPLVDANGHVIV